MMQKLRMCAGSVRRAPVVSAVTDSFQSVNSGPLPSSHVGRPALWRSAGREMDSTARRFHSTMGW
jgi:hypothetical protein